MSRGTDEELVRRTRVRLGLQTATAITASVLVVGVLAFFVVHRSEHSAAKTLLEHTFATEEDVIDTPPGVWIFDQAPDGTVSATTGAPGELPDRADLARVRAGGTGRIVDLHTDRGGFRVLTRRRGDHVVQVAASLGAESAEMHRLLLALGLAELAGLLIAFLFAVLLSQRATAPLVDALTRQRQFVADASHELRTPLTQLHLRAQLLHADLHAGATGPGVADDVEELVLGTRRLGEVVEDLLTSSRLTDRPHDAVPVDVGAVAAGVVTEYVARAREQVVTLTLVPAAGGPATVRGREAALRRVLTALVDNALSHTPPGGHVTVEVAVPPRHVSVSVRDNGTGFDPADTEKLFTRFARGHDDHRRFGLGLALAREVVAGHGGHIDASGRPGEGATFTVVLPAG